MVQFDFINYCLYLLTCKTGLAGVVELVDTLDLGSSAARCESSSLSARTKKASQIEKLFLFLAFSILNIKPLYLFQ